MTATLGTIALILALAWVFGGIALRAGGALVFWVGLIGLATSGDPQAIFVIVLGALAWLAGQGHHALRHGTVRSRLAEVIFAAVGGLLSSLREDPTGPARRTTSPTEPDRTEERGRR